MFGLNKELDLSFFVGKRLDQVSFAEYVIFFHFEDHVNVSLESSHQHKRKQDVENQRSGVTQSVPVSNSTLMQLVGHSVVSVTGSDDGTLTLVFDDGQVLHFLEHKSPHESYNFSDGKDVHVV